MPAKAASQIWTDAPLTDNAAWGIGKSVIGHTYKSQHFRGLTSALAVKMHFLSLSLALFLISAKGQVDIELESENYVIEVHSEIHCSGSVLKVDIVL